MRALDRGAWPGLLAAGTVVASTFLVRQTGLFLGLGGAAWSAFVHGRGERSSLTARARNVSLFLGPTLLAVLAHAVVFRQTAGLDPRRLVNIHPCFTSWTACHDLALRAAREAAAGMLNICPLLLPLAIPALSTLAPFRARPWLRTVLWALVLLLLGTTFYILRDQPLALRGWPFQGNYLTRYGTLAQPSCLELPVPRPAWWAVTAVAPILAAWGLSAGLRAAAEFRSQCTREGRATALLLFLGAFQLPSALIGSAVTLAVISSSCSRP